MIYWQMKLNRINIISKDYEKTGFVILLFVMAGYYGYRLFSLTPWYDELYTYYFFISRGPVYAAIHWPVPNNHVGYSVLSAFLDYLGNPYIGLRGISYLCALINMVLLFQIGRHYLSKGLSLMAVILYVSMNLVNQLAVQGRGYTLGVTCYLSAFLCLTMICREETCSKRYYVIFALALILGLYTLTSDVYWVLPVCFTGGIYLLYRGILESKENGEKFKKCKSIVKLGRLITASIIAAVITFLLYSVIWLAIGSNLLVKDETSGFFGMGHLELLLKAPFKAFITGMEYMLATPYIQSVERSRFWERFFDWILGLFNMYYDGLGILITVIALSGILCLAITIIKGMYGRKKESLLFPLFLLVGILCLPVFLILQCTLPYYRVFKYGGVLLALIIVFLAQQMSDRIKTGKENRQKKTADMIAVSFLLLTLVFAGSRFCNKEYHSQYGLREYYIQDALLHSNIEEAENICVTDCTQQYLMKFLYDITCENTQIEGTDLLLLDKKMTDSDYNELEWEFYHYYDTVPWEYVNNYMDQIYENEDFVLYIKKQM